MNWSIDFAPLLPGPILWVLVALAIALNYYNNHLTIDVDRGTELHG